MPLRWIVLVGISARPRNRLCRSIKYKDPVYLTQTYEASFYFFSSSSFREVETGSVSYHLFNVLNIVNVCFISNLAALCVYNSFRWPGRMEDQRR